MWSHMVILFLDWTRIFKWYMARFEVKSGHIIYTCDDEIGLCAQILLTIPTQLVT